VAGLTSELALLGAVGAHREDPGRPRAPKPCDRDPLAVRGEGRLKVSDGAVVGGDPSFVSATGADRKDRVDAVALAAERYSGPGRRKGRVVVESRVAGQLALIGAVGADGEDLRVAVEGAEREPRPPNVRSGGRRRSPAAKHQERDDRGGEAQRQQTSGLMSARG